jgi:integrase
MPYVQKGSKFLYISYTDASGKRVKESSGTTSRTEARALESKRRAEVHQVKKWGAAPRYTFDQVLSRYLRDTASKKSHSRDLTSALPLTAELAGMVIEDIGGEHISAYKTKRREQGAKPATVAKELYLLSAAIRYCVTELEWELRNPVTGRVPAPEKKAPRWLNRQEIDAFMAGAEGNAARRHRTSPVVVDFARLCIATGMRTGEALGLEWARVDFGARMIYFDIEDQKSGVPGSIPLNNTAIEVLRKRQAYNRDHCPNSAWVFAHSDGERIQSLKKAVATAAKRAQLARVTPHTFRHTFGALMIQARTPIRDLCELMRHADIRTTMIYAHLAPENGRLAISAMDQVLAPATEIGGVPARAVA